MSVLAVSIVNIADIAGGLATAIGLLGGIYFAYRYSRKASASVAATANNTADGVLIAVRPSVTSAGVFNLHFDDSSGATIKVAEVTVHESNLTYGKCWEQTEVFQEQFVTGGETLTTMILFPVGIPESDVVGWRVTLSIRAKGILRSGMYWGDRMFVPRAD